MNNDGFPRQLIRLLFLEEEDEAGQREDEGQTAGRSGVANDCPDVREESSHKSGNHQQNYVEHDDVNERRPNRIEKRVHHLWRRNEYREGCN